MPSPLRAFALRRRRPGARLAVAFSARLGLVGLLGLSPLACDGDPDAGIEDGGAGGGAQDASPYDDGGPGGFDADLTVPSDAADDAGDTDGLTDGATLTDGGVPCADDVACGERSHCSVEGRCAPDRESPAFLPPADGLTRAGAGRFDLAPVYLETWEDRAGADCPENRLGRFDGQLDDPEPADPCLDRFTDADGDGRFDAIWLGGGGPDRAALGVDNQNPPEGRVLVLARDTTVQVIVTLDVHALDAARVADLQRRLRARLGLDASAFAVHATGSRSGPDAVGLDGPSLRVAGGAAGEALALRAGARLGLLETVPYASGVDEAWFAALAERAAVAVDRALRRAEPVQLRAHRTGLPVEAGPGTPGARPPGASEGGPAWQVPDANEDGRANDASDLAAYAERRPALALDTQLPPSPDPWLRVLALDSTVNGAPVALVAAWGAAPAASDAAVPVLSADFPGVFRRRVEATRGGVALWLTAANADTVLAGRGAFVPTVDDAGQPVDAAGRVVADLMQAAPAADPVEALGHFFARRALDAVAARRPGPADLTRSSRWVWLPLTNPRHGLAADLGVLAPFADWLSGRTMARAWVSGATTPACGGLGCARYRLDLVGIGPVSLLLTPGALDGGLARGRADLALDFADARALRDLDADGVPDVVDDAVVVESRSGDRDLTVRVAAPANPQRFTATTGLETDYIWLIGRVGGGVGTLQPAESSPNPFEGQADPLVEFAQSPSNAGIELCNLGYPCAGPLRLADLARGLVDRQPQVLADLPGGQELRLADPDQRSLSGPWAFSLTDAEGRVRLAGDDLVLGPDDLAYSPSQNFRRAGLQRGDRLRVPERRAAAFFTVLGLVPLVVRSHPNGGDAWSADSPHGGDLLYNGACELLFGGACPHPRPVSGEDPNLTLPRQP